MMSFGLFTPTCLLCSLLLIYFEAVSATWLYENQFPGDSEKLRLPSIVFFSIFMGRVSYPHLPLLLESMRLNPRVRFILINVVDSIEHSQKIIRLGQRHSVQNFLVHVVTMSEFSELVHRRLNISVQLDSSWYYKMCDFKPTLAYLFPELAHKDTYQYWGFGDMDVIWGNISRFSHWFQGQYPFVHTYWNKPHGSAQFYVNEDWTCELFLIDPVYRRLLENKTYFNLDEIGTQIRQENVVNSGYHAIGYAHVAAAKKRKFNMNCNRGTHQYDNAYLEQEDSVRWAGPIRWFQGSLQIVRGSQYFPPGRELMYFHRPEKRLDFPVQMKRELFADMMKFGYLLPNWIPLSTRFACRDADYKPSLAMMNKYTPYAAHCFKWWYDEKPR